MTSTVVPIALTHYLRMWNELDVGQIKTHLDLAVSDDCLWVDPQHSHTGRSALEANVLGFRQKYPRAVLSLASELDGHHNRYRYHWEISIDGVTLIHGFDVVTLNGEGVINRVDGFFGLLERREAN